MPTRPARPPDPSHHRRAERANIAASRSVGPASTRGRRRHRRFRARRHGSAEPRASRSPRRRGCPTARRCPRAGEGDGGAPQRARMAARRTRSTPVRLLGDKVDARTLGGPRSPVLASRKVSNEVAYWRRTRRRLLTCEAASRASPRGAFWPPSPRRPRRGAHVPGAHDEADTRVDASCARASSGVFARTEQHVGQLFDGATSCERQRSTGTRVDGSVRGCA